MMTSKPETREKVNRNRSLAPAFPVAEAGREGVGLALVESMTRSRGNQKGRSSRTCISLPDPAPARGAASHPDCRTETFLTIGWPSAPRVHLGEARPHLFVGAIAPGHRRRW